MTRSRARWVFTAACLVLSGCGNAYEHITVGEWQEVGKAEPPESRSKGAYVVTTLTEGNGPAVEAGDLVKARVQPIADRPADLPRPEDKEPEAQIVWVWTGQEPPSSDQEQWVIELDTFGNLGTARARAALIGRRLQEQFEIHLEPGSEGHGDQLPLRAVSEQQFAGLKVGGAEIAGKPVIRRKWPALPLATAMMNRPAARIEILNICKARLLRRTATLSQLGVIFATGDAQYASARKGTLGWTAIEAQCPAPDGQVRIQAGPFHHTGYIPHQTLLADWSSSYVKLRPPYRYPEEWQEGSDEPAWSIINKRLAPIRERIAKLNSEQQTADLECAVAKKCETTEQTEKRRQQRDRLLEEAAKQRKALECELEKKCE